MMKARLVSESLSSSSGADSPLLSREKAEPSMSSSCNSNRDEPAWAAECDSDPPQLLASPSRLWTQDGAIEEEVAIELSTVRADGARVVIARVLMPPAVPCRAVHLFRRSPSQTVQLLVNPRADDLAAGFPPPTAPAGRGLSPSEVARWMLSCQRLSTNHIGDFLGRPDAQPVLSALVELLDFRSLELDAALRSFLSLFRLPGEAQQIERIMESFSKRYAACQRDAESEADDSQGGAGLGCADTVHVLCYSLIMLNVDAHSARIPRHQKMTVSQFVSNNRGVDAGADLPTSLLQRLYASVVAHEIRIEQREFIQSSFKGWLYKRGGRWRSWNRRYVILSSSVLYYFRTPDDAEPLGLVPLEDIRVNTLGWAPCGPRRTFSLQPLKPVTRIKSLKAPGAPAPGAAKAFTLGRHTSFVFSADTPAEMDEWVSAIEAAMVWTDAPDSRSPGGACTPERGVSWGRCLRVGEQRPSCEHRDARLQAAAARSRGWKGVKLRSMSVPVPSRAGGAGADSDAHRALI